jgi:hypothetical protein
MGDTQVAYPAVMRGTSGQSQGNVPRRLRTGPLMVDPALVSVPNSFNLQRNGINYDVVGRSFEPVDRERIPDDVFSNGYPRYTNANFRFRRSPYGRFPDRPYYTGSIPTYPSYAYNYVNNDNPYLDPQYRNPYNPNPSQYAEPYNPRSVATQACLRRHGNCTLYPNPNDCRACVNNQSPGNQNFPNRCADRICGGYA